MEDVGRRESVAGRNREWETRENVWREGDRKWEKWAEKGVEGLKEKRKWK